MKILIYRSIDGFLLPEEFWQLYKSVVDFRLIEVISDSYRLKYYKNYISPDTEIHPEKFKRDDPTVIYVVETLKKIGLLPHLKVVEIPDDVDWEINSEYGVEWVAEKHRKWH